MSLTLEETIKTIPSQFSWEPTVERAEKLPASIKDILVCGLGGSGLAARALAALYPEIPLRYHQSYGIPQWFPCASKEESLVVLSSYSGNTEEVISSFEEALSSGLPLVAVSAGGKLEELAQAHEVPYVRLPDVLQPRYAIGYSFAAVATLCGRKELLNEVIAQDENTARIEELTEFFSGALPVVWSTSVTAPLAYIWKILFNESVKRLCVYNKMPELNHNEMNAFEQLDKLPMGDTKPKVLILSDPSEHPRETLRVESAKKVLESRGVEVKVYRLEGENKLSRFVTGVQEAMEVTLALAHQSEIDPEPVKIVEDFKKMLQG